jgi:mono/diheme cytochrome c family protein
MTGAAVAGELLLVSGGKRGGVAQVGQFNGEAPVSLVAADGSVYVGTSKGRLLHLANGAWTDEPGLPSNLGVTALAVDAAGQLLAGVHMATGPRVLRRTAKLGAPPLAPTNLAGTATVLNRVDLTWTDASNDETSFTIERAPAGTTTFARVGSAPANATAYADGSVAAATDYDYRVLAVNAAGASTPSNTARVTSLAAPAAPTYVADVKPILAGKNLLNISCAGCHAAGRSYQLSANLVDDTADYTASLKQINTVTPTDSELLTRPTQTRGHPVKLLNVGSPEYDTIVRWIQGGAKFN